jgi:hypothetical protein
MESETPGQGAGPDQGASAPEPAWTTPPPASPGPAPASGSWNAAPQQPAQPAAPAWGQPAAPGQWGGAPQQPAPAAQPAPQWNAQQQQPGWGQQPAPAPQQPAQPGWGQQPAPAPQPAPQAQPGWGQQPAPQPAWNPAQQPPVQQQPQQQGQWGAPAAATGYGAPPPQQPVPQPQPGWGAPGGPQPGWSGGPPAKSGNNGCLKACLIVAVIGIVLAIIAVIALFALARNVGDGLGVDSNGNLKDCGIVSSQQLQTVLGKDTEAHPMSGIINATIGATLDKRVLPDADNCYILSGTRAIASADQATGSFGRVAKYSGDASGTFSKELQNAKDGKYFAINVSGAGDQAFCTGLSDTYPATGALVRKGSDLVYVSLLITDFSFSQASGENGVEYSPNACDQAIKIAKLALH